MALLDQIFPQGQNVPRGTGQVDPATGLPQEILDLIGQPPAPPELATPERRPVLDAIMQAIAGLQTNRGSPAGESALAALRQRRGEETRATNIQQQQEHQQKVEAFRSNRDRLIRGDERREAREARADERDEDREFQEKMLGMQRDISEAQTKNSQEFAAAQAKLGRDLRRELAGAQQTKADAESARQDLEIKQKLLSQASTLRQQLRDGSLTPEQVRREFLDVVDPELLGTGTTAAQKAGQMKIFNTRIEPILREFEAEQQQQRDTPPRPGVASAFGTSPVPFIGAGAQTLADLLGASFDTPKNPNLSPGDASVRDEAERRAAARR